MKDDSTRSLERPAFAALVAFLAAPVIAQGLWRPLVHFFGPSGDSAVVTWAALTVSGAIVIAEWLRPRRSQLLTLALGGLFAIGASFGLSLGVPGLLTLLSVATANSFLVRRLPALLPSALDGLARRHKLLFVLYVVLALAAVVSTARMSIFMGDSTRADQQVLPGEKFLETHSCLTAYVRAATLSEKHVDNLYAERFWYGSHGLPPAPAGVPNPYHPFRLDYYAYPPPFLLAMVPLGPFSGDFPAQRALWFGFTGILLAVGLWIAARRIDGPTAHRALLLAPIFFGSLPVLGTLQIGNFQVAVVVLSLLAMIAFQRDRPVIGGALLAFTILSKLSPGVLGIVLLAQRRFRCAAWTAGFGVFFLALSVLTLGVNPLESFLTYTLPRIMSGEAFAFLDDDPFTIRMNMAPFGLPFKLQLIGLDIGDPWRLARLFGRVYTAALVILAVVAVRRLDERRAQPLTWLSLLVLAALQSPLAPLYTIIALLWAITLLAVEVHSLRGGIGLVLLWILLTVLPPTGSLPLLAAYSILGSTLIVGVPIWLIVRTAPVPEESSLHVQEIEHDRNKPNHRPPDGLRVS